LAKGILELKNNPVLRRQLAQNGYECLKQNFSEQRIGERLKAILHTI